MSYISLFVDITDEQGQLRPCRHLAMTNECGVRLLDLNYGYTLSGMPVVVNRDLNTVSFSHGELTIPYGTWFENRFTIHTKHAASLATWLSNNGEFIAEPRSTLLDQWEARTFTQRDFSERILSD